MANKKRPVANQELQELRTELEQAKARIGEEKETNARLGAENRRLGLDNIRLQSALSSALSENARIAEHARKQARTIKKLQTGIDGLTECAKLEQSRLVQFGGGH